MDRLGDGISGTGGSSRQPSSRKDPRASPASPSAAPWSSAARPPLATTHRVVHLSSNGPSQTSSLDPGASAAQSAFRGAILPQNQAGRQLLTRFYKCKNQEHPNPTSFGEMQSIIAQFSRDLSLLRGLDFGGEPLTIKNLQDMFQSEQVKVFISGGAGPVANGLTFAVSHFFPSSPRSHAEIEYLRQASALMERWEFLKSDGDFESMGFFSNPIDEMQTIIGEFTRNSQLLQSYTVANNKPLKLDDLEDQVRLKEIDLILQGKITRKGVPEANALAREIKDDKRRAAAFQMITATPAERFALKISPQVIRNPANSCFMNASLVSLLANQQNFLYIREAISRIEDSTANPTIEGANDELVAACAAHPLDADYTRWQIENDGQKITTFLRMTLGDAAKCARALIEKWRKGDELNVDESNLLRLALSKLTNISYNSRIPDQFPFINTARIGSILPGKTEDSNGFTRSLLNGLNELVPGLAEGNPFRIPDALRTADQVDSDLHPIGIYLSTREKVLSGDRHISVPDTAMGPEIQGLRRACFDPGIEGRKAVLSIQYAGGYVDPALGVSQPRPTNFTLFRSLMEDEKEYQLDSIVLRKGDAIGYSGHYVALKRAEVPVDGQSEPELVWLYYDDAGEPPVKVMDRDEVESILRGEVRGIDPLSFVFSDPTQDYFTSSQRQEPQISRDLTVLSSLFEPPAEPEGVFTHPDQELNYNFNRLLAEGKFEVAIKVARRIQDPDLKEANFRHILDAVSRREVAELLDGNARAIAQLSTFKVSLTQEIDNLSAAPIRPRRPRIVLDQVAGSGAAGGSYPPQVPERSSHVAPSPLLVASELPEQRTQFSAVLKEALEDPTKAPDPLPKSHTVDQKLKHRCKELIADGQLDVAAHLALGLQDSKEKIKGLKYILAVASESKVFDALRGQTQALEQLGAFKSNLAARIESLLSPPVVGSRRPLASRDVEVLRVPQQTTQPIQTRRAPVDVPRRSWIAWLCSCLFGCFSRRAPEPTPSSIQRRVNSPLREPLLPEGRRVTKAARPIFSEQPIIDGLAPKSPSSSPLRRSSSLLLGTPPRSSSVRASAASPHRASAASAPRASSPSIDQRIEAALVAELESGGIRSAFDLIESKKSSGVRQTQLNKAYLIVGLAAIMSSLHNSQKRENAVRALGLMTESSERRKLQGYITRLNNREKLATVQDSIRRELPNGPFKSSLN